MAEQFDAAGAGDEELAHQETVDDEKSEMARFRLVARRLPGPDRDRGHRRSYGLSDGVSLGDRYRGLKGRIGVEKPAPTRAGRRGEIGHGARVSTRRARGGHATGGGVRKANTVSPIGETVFLQGRGGWDCYWP